MQDVPVYRSNHPNQLRSSDYMDSVIAVQHHLRRIQEDSDFRDKMPYHVEPEDPHDGDGFKNLRNSSGNPASYRWTDFTYKNFAAMVFRPESGKGRWCTLCRHRVTKYECTELQCPHKFVCVHCFSLSGEQCLFCREGLSNQPWMSSMVGTDSLGSTTFGVNTLKDRRDLGLNFVPLVCTASFIDRMMNLRLKMAGVEEEVIAPRRVILPTGPNIALGMH